MVQSLLKLELPQNNIAFLYMQHHLHNFRNSSNNFTTLPRRNPLYCYNFIIKFDFKGDGVLESIVDVEPFVPSVQFVTDCVVFAYSFVACENLDVLHFYYVLCIAL
jgi:hypothetical protein